MKQFVKYIVASWPEVACNTSIALLSILFAFVLYKAEVNRSNNESLDNLKRSIALAAREVMVNRSSIEKGYNQLCQKGMMVGANRLMLTASSELLRNPLLPKYTDLDFFLGLSQYIYASEYINGHIIDRLLTKHTDTLDFQYMFSAYSAGLKKALIFSIVLQLYSYSFDIKTGPSLYCQDTLVNWLQDRDCPSIPNLQKMLKQVSQMPGRERDEYKRGFQKMLGKLN